MIKPSAETNDPEPPLLNRTAEDRRCSAQPGGGWNPYRALSCAKGSLLNSHIPSSAWTETDIAKLASKKGTRTNADGSDNLIEPNSSEPGTGLIPLPHEPDAPAQVPARSFVRGVT